MPKEKCTSFLRIYRIVLSVSIALCALCFMIACLQIYYSGDAPYSREAVAAAFSQICIPVYLCIGLTAVNFIFTLVFPQPEVTPRRSSDLRHTLRRLQSTREPSPEAAAAIRELTQNRKTLWLCQGSVIAASALFFLIYALNPAHFLSDGINTSMVRAMLRLLPCLILSVGISIFAAEHRERSALREIEILKKMPKLDTPKTEPTVSEVKIPVFRWVFLCTGIVLVVVGLLNGGVADVLAKAVNICTECIGLG